MTAFSVPEVPSSHTRMLFTLTARQARLRKRRHGGGTLHPRLKPQAPYLSQDVLLGFGVSPRAHRGRGSLARILRSFIARSGELRVRRARWYDFGGLSV
jgi:hypothetical protein